MNFNYAAGRDSRLLVALVFSVSVHVFLLSYWPVYRQFFTAIMRPADVEVTYLKAKEPQIAKKAEGFSRRPEPLPEIESPQKPVEAEPPKTVTAEKISETEVQKKESVPVAPRKAAGKKPGTEQTSKIIIKEPAVPKIETIASVDASVEPRGLRLIPPSYSQVVRDRIMDNIDTSKTGGEGDVYVRFIITSSGALKEVGVIDEKSSSDGVLRAAAFRAVKDSAPFPVFPERVTLPEIAFTCQISFARK